MNELAIDWEDVAGVLDGMRALLAAHIAALIAEGFTDEQAHSIITDLIHTGAQGAAS